MPQKRTYPPSSSPFPHTAPVASPDRPLALRERLRRLYGRFRTLVFFGLGTFLALASANLYAVGFPAVKQVTQRDLDAAVARALEEAPPKPYYASQVFGVIRPSLVEVRASAQAGKGRTDDRLGTGVIVDESGSVLTSLHVVDGATRVQVTFADRSESEATVVARQAQNDLAVLRPLVVPDDLVPATLADSASLRVGDEVVAVGNPFGITNSLSAGVVSGLGRSFVSPKTGDTLRNLIQFDAAVNPGNSGGPLLDRNGELVGIVTALLNPTKQDFFVGIGFAVRIETAMAAMGTPPY